MQDRPTAADVLATIKDYLEGEVLPSVSGTLRYHTLVAANLVTMLQRELEQYPAAAAAETEALRQLLGRSDGDLAELNAELARQLREAQPDDDETEFERRTLQALLPATLAKLQISKPGYERYDMATEVTV
jgi:hypothetical protein